MTDKYLKMELTRKALFHVTLLVSELLLKLQEKSKKISLNVTLYRKSVVSYTSVNLQRRAEQNPMKQ